MDGISSLPDEVLGIILSFISTKEAASTSVLSKRWRNVFVLVSTLDLEYPENFIAFEYPDLENLLNLQGNTPIKKLTLKSIIQSSSLEPTRVKSWICNVLDRGVVDLDLFFTCLDDMSPPVPSLIFKSKTLVKLKLGCGFSIYFSHHDDVYLPVLKSLCTDTVWFNGDHGFETLVSRCPVLEELVVKDQLWKPWSGFVCSSSLKRLYIQVKTIASISFDVPNLVYFELSCEFRSKYGNVKMDSLVEARLNLWVKDNLIKKARRGNAHLVYLINGIRNVKTLHLSKDVLELLYSCQELPVFNNLVCLSIESDKKRGWQILPLLIKNSPNLETLIFKGLNHLRKKCGDACPCQDSEETVSSCLSSCRVKLLEILSYRGTTREFNLVKHFLLNLQCLELVKILSANNILVARDMEKLLTLPRASSNCEIQVIKRQKSSD